MFDIGNSGTSSKASASCSPGLSYTPEACDGCFKTACQEHPSRGENRLKTRRHNGLVYVPNYGDNNIMKARDISIVTSVASEISRMAGLAHRLTSDLPPKKSQIAFQMYMAETLGKVLYNAAESGHAFTIGSNYREAYNSAKSLDAI